MFECEAFFAFAALIRTLGGVEQQMSVQAMLVTEILSAVRTLDRNLKSEYYFFFSPEIPEEGKVMKFYFTT